MKKPFASWMAIALAVLMPLHVYAAGGNGSGSSGALTVKPVAACSSGSCPPEGEPITKEGDNL